MKRKRSITRTKGSRVAIRQRPVSLMLPRSFNHVKVKPARPSSGPLPPPPPPRKRRTFGRFRHAQQGPATSEGDMAQADEMGDEGEGHSDDGYVEGTEEVKKKVKKKQGGMHVLMPSISAISPPSSPSNTPVSVRRRVAARKVRTKPRAKKLTKPASADISAQETTTPCPGTSDSDNIKLEEEEEEVDSQAQNSSTAPDRVPRIDELEEYSSEDIILGSPIAEEKELVEQEDPEMSRIVYNMDRKRAPGKDIKNHTTVQNGIRAGIGYKAGGTKPSTASGTRSKTSREQESNNESQTSDAEFTSTSAISLSSGRRGHKLESDLSTAPFSSETSDMETSGNEKTSKNSGIPRPSPKSSPVLGRKPTPTSVTKVGGSSSSKNGLGVSATKESKRNSVAAMVSQFSTYGTVTSTSTRPTISKGPKSPVVKETVDSLTSSSSEKVSKPEPPKPYQAGKFARKTSSPDQSPDMKDSRKNPNASVKPSSVANSDATSKANPPLPPKPKSPPAVSKAPPTKKEDSSLPNDSSESTKSDDSPISRGTRRPATKKTSGITKPSSTTNSSANDTYSSSTKITFVSKTTSTYTNSALSSKSASATPTNDSLTSSKGPLNVTKNSDPLQRKVTPPSNAGSKATKKVVASSKLNKDSPPSSIKGSTESIPDKKDPVSKSKSDRGKAVTKTVVTKDDAKSSQKNDSNSKPLTKTEVTKEDSKSKIVTKEDSKSKPAKEESKPATKIEKTKEDGKSKLVSKTEKTKDSKSVKKESPKEDSKFMFIRKPRANLKETKSADTAPSSKSTLQGAKSQENLLSSSVETSIKKPLRSPQRPPPPPPAGPPQGEKGRSLKRNNPGLESPDATTSEKQLLSVTSSAPEREKSPRPRVKPLGKHYEEVDIPNNNRSKSPRPKTSPLSSPSENPQNYEEFVPAKTYKKPDLTKSDSLPKIAPPPPPTHSRKASNSSSQDIELHYEGVDFAPQPSASSTEDEESHYEGVVIRRNINVEQSLPSSLPRIKPPSPPQQRKTKGKEPVAVDNDPPPPLPPRSYLTEDPVISLPVSLSTVEEHRTTSKETESTKQSSNEAVPPPLPSQPIPKRKSMLGGIFSAPTNSLLKRKEIPASLIQAHTSPPPPVTSPTPKSSRRPENLYEEIDIRSRAYEDVDIGPTARKRSESLSRSTRGSTKSGSSDDEDRKRFSASVFVSGPPSLSPVSMRRANSDRFNKNRMPVTLSPEDNDEVCSIPRTSSMDILDERMNQTTRTSLTDPGYSSGEEGSASPIDSLPKPPKIKFLDVSPSSDDDPEDEPLYQHINHIAFSTPVLSKRVVVQPKKDADQLEIARQLSFNHRKLWCEQPEVMESGILSKISEQERKLQETMFEVITSEASYLRSLGVLIDHFMEDPGMNPNLPEGRRILDKRQHHVIFSNVKEVQDASERFLKELQERQRGSTLIENICDIVLKYAERNFSCYVPYCTNQVYQTREMTELLEKNVMFRDYIRRLESHKKCQSLSFTSFLLLPMQRITRLPLLILAILNRTSQDDPNHSLVEKTLRSVQSLVTACNDGARKMERTEELHQIHKQLDFGKLKPFPLVSVSRQLERKGALTLLEVEQRLFGKPRIKRTSLYVFAFTDYILLTKRKKTPKGDFTYKVQDFASKAVVEVQSLKTQDNATFPKPVFGEQETLARATWTASAAAEPNSFLLMFLENASQKPEKYIMAAQNDTDRTRWLEVLAHPSEKNKKEDEKIYESWDCPQVQAVYDYQAKQPDELGLIRGDVVKVYRKMADGWYEGERLRDLQWGWFPSNFTMEIENAHTRARNLRERHRLLSLPFSPDKFTEHISSSSS